MLAVTSADKIWLPTIPVFSWGTLCHRTVNVLPSGRDAGQQRRCIFRTTVRCPVSHLGIKRQLMQRCFNTVCKPAEHTDVGCKR